MVYMKKRESVVDPARPNGWGNIVEYIVDDISDISKLPGASSGEQGSTAFVISTAVVYMLGSNGWVQI